MFQQSDIAAKIKAMGGTHSSNLMSDVTVLVVGDRNTDKFRFSVKNRSDVKFIRPEAIIEIHKRWLNSDDKKDPNALDIDQFLLPIFDGFKICLSRVNTDEHFNGDEKTELIKIITDHGGEVSDSLTGSTTCVITNEKTGKRYTMSRKWKIPNVHPLWVLHCVKRKAALEFNYYDIDVVEQIKNIGEGSCKVWDGLKKHKRRNVVIDPEEQVKKKPDIWNTIMSEAKKSVTSSKRRDEEWDEDQNEDDDDIDLNVPVVNTSKKLSFIELPVTSELFANKSFKVEFFDDEKTATLVKTILSHSGQVIQTDDPDSSPSYYIIPSDFSTLDIPEHLFENPETEVMTEFFIERSLHYNAIKEDTWGKPFFQALPESPRLSVSITGFQGIELLHVTKMIELSSLQFHEYLTKDRDMLIVNYDLLRAKSGEHLVKKYPTLFDENFKKTASQTSVQSTRNKLSFARKNSTPIVTITFLFETFNSGMIFNINSKDCCIYCPKLVNLKESLMSLTMSDLQRSVPPLQKCETLSSSSSLPKLPSPIRNKRQDKWGRLVGRAPESQFNKQALDNLSTSTGDFPDEESNQMKSTQIGYGDSEGNVNLLKILKKIDSDDQHKGRTTSKAPETRTRTRQGYKDMLGILDNE